MLRTLTGSLVTYTFDAKNNRYVESDFGDARNIMYFDKAKQFWILYNAETQQRLVFDMQGRLHSAYKDGLDVCQYEYDKSGRLITITPASDPATARSYVVSYADNSVGDLVSISIVSKKNTMLLREYQFNKAGMLQTTSVINRSIISLVWALLMQLVRLNISMNIILLGLFHK